LPSTSKLAPELYKSLNKSIPSVGNKAGQTLGQRMSATATKWLKRGAVVGAAAAGAAIGAVLVGGFKSAIDQQKIQATVGGLYQDGDKAFKTLEKIKKLSSSSPIDYSAYGKAAQSLAYAGVEGDQAVTVLDKVGWAIVGAGGGATELDRAMAGLLKGVNNGGVVMNDTLAMISESGYPIIDGLSAKFDTTGDVIKKMAAKGEISIDDVLSVMENGTGKLARSQASAGKEVAKTFGESFKIAKDNVTVAIGETMIPLLEKLAPMMKPIADALVKGIEKLPAILSTVVGLFKEWWPILATVVGGIAAYSLTLKAIAIGQAIWNGLLIAQKFATAGAAVQMRILNAAMKANPIGLIITAVTLLVAGFILMYKKVGWFRNGVNAAWAGIKIAVSAVAAWFQAYVWPVMQAVWNGIVVGAKWLWNGIKVVWNGIMVAVRAVVAWFQTYVAPVIKAVFSVIGAVFRWLWKNIAVPVFNGIKLIVTTWWKGVKIIFNAVISFVKNYLAPVFQLFWAIIKVVWKGIRLAISTAWNFIKKYIFTPIVNWVNTKIVPRFRFLQAVIRVVWAKIRQFIYAAWAYIRKNIFQPIVNWINTHLAPKFKFLRDTVQNVWAKIKSSISTVWNFIRDKVFNPLKSAITKAVPDAFEKGKDAIGKAWDKVRDIAKKPVKFMISTVINSGIIKNFNKIASKFGVKKMPYVQLPKGFSSGGWTGNGSKYTPAGIVHADEFVIQKSSRRRIERQTPGALDYMNKTGRLPELGGYANGGAVWSNLWRINKEKFPNSRLTSSVRNSTTVSGNKSLHASGMAIDVAGPRSMDTNAMMKMATWWRNNYGSKLAELIYTPLGKKQIKNGQNYQYTGAVAAQHKNHVHIAARKAMDGKGGLPGGGGGTDWMSWLNPFKKLKDTIKNKMPKAGAFGKIVASGAKKMVQAPIDWISEKASALFDFVGDVGTKVKDVVTSGVGRTRGKAWAKAQGWPIKGGARWNALDYIITRESSWNPKAKNPSSTASGLGQFINSTSRAYMGGSPMSKYPFDKQLAGVVKYTADRYGGLVPAMNFWKKHHYYAKGTLSAARGWATVGENGPELIKLRGGEQIKSNRNSKKFIDEHTDDKGRVVLNVNFNGRVDDPNEAVNKLQFEVNRLFAGGRYK
jgi:phage-related protein